MTKYKMINFLTRSFFFFIPLFILEINPCLAEDKNTSAYLSLPKIQKLPLKDTHIVPKLQKQIESYLQNRNNPIAASVVIEARSGKILAMVESDQKSNKKNIHNALWAKYPAASIFKLVPTIAAIEDIGINPWHNFSYNYPCQSLNKIGNWFQNAKNKSQNKINLAIAFGQSCNVFFARLGIRYLGTSLLNDWANKLGWGNNISADFQIPTSTIATLQGQGASLLSIGKYSAGFGKVFLSPVHAAWLFLSLANRGKNISLSLYKKTTPSAYSFKQELMKEETAQKVIKILHKTINIGTAKEIFNSKRYRSLKKIVGGKTGTLMGKTPFGLTTWFVGLIPRENPQFIVSSVVVNEQKWFIKATHLAAETFLLLKKNLLVNEKI